jgi:hypothetical protein
MADAAVSKAWLSFTETAEEEVRVGHVVSVTSSSYLLFLERRVLLRPNFCQLRYSWKPLRSDECVKRPLTAQLLLIIFAKLVLPNLLGLTCCVMLR